MIGSSAGIQVQPEHSGIPAQWFDGLCRALPGARIPLASVAAKLRRPTSPIDPKRKSHTGQFSGPDDLSVIDVIR